MNCRARICITMVTGSKPRWPAKSLPPKEKVEEEGFGLSLVGTWTIIRVD